MSLLRELTRLKISQIKRRRSDRIIKSIPNRFVDVDEYLKSAFVPLEYACEFSIGWNKERNKKLKEKLQKMTGT